MFGQFGVGEMMLLVIVGLFVFGPERLPTIARDAARMFKQFRDQARTMRDDLQAELGPELADLDLKSLNPKTLVEKHLFGEDDDEPAAPRSSTPAPRPAPRPANGVASEIPLTKPARPQARPDATPYDGDAT
jgi:sec-independent protein translocase protein TatB